MRVARGQPKGVSSGYLGWAFVYVVLVMFTIGTIVVFHMIPSHDKVSLNYSPRFTGKL